MSLASAMDVVLKINPVPGLSFAFTLFTFIVSTVNEVQASKTQLEALAISIGQLLATLNAEFRAAKLNPKTSAHSLAELKLLLEDIHRFVEKEQDRGFISSLLNQDSRMATIDGFYRRIAITVNAFQISALLNVQSMILNDRRAKEQDTGTLQQCFESLEKSHLALRRTLDINQNNMLALMVSIQRKLDAQENGSAAEHKFLSHALQYLSSSGGSQVRVEHWMISPFEVEYGAEIGQGGFGKVYKGTWNHTEVAIKVVRTACGVTPDLSILRKEIRIWSTLRHPNILQFLGANTLDDQPFIVMPYIQENSRQFLDRRTDFNPVYILRDISLGLEYLHCRKISHGDLKGVNVLIDLSARALLCDFGLARIKADVSTRTGSKEPFIGSGSRNWMAPELLTGSSPRPASDIYAFGMTVYELYANEIPLATVAYGDYCELVVRNGVRPRRPSPDESPRLDNSVWELAERCWVADAKARPAATDLHETISRLIHPNKDPRPNVKESSPSHINRSPTEFSLDSRPVSAQRPSVSQSNNSNHSSRSAADEELRKQKDVQAAVLYQLQRLLGNDDPETLNAMHDLACIYYQLGRLEAAEELQNEVAQRRTRILGPDHPDTLTAMHSLTFTLRRFGRLADALALGISVMESRKRVLGKEHVNTLGAMHNLALTYFDLGRFAKAAELQESVMDGQRRVLGREHLDLLTTMHNLAATYYSQGRFRDAEKVLVSTLEKRKRVLGKDHPSTLLTFERLIETHEKQGKTIMAKSHLTRPV
ncbi:kinase-like domain-containing protein [Mycena alexandri]|uniref:Kinase-like domain-containing protein n=1 Tax=Mycena alexandri TaxID=1745969 RepID=A0AAD6X9D0_9AGAR|nr:kinase-like domain-containing protein [Mycena alexandri]